MIKTYFDSDYEQVSIQAQVAWWKAPFGKRIVLLSIKILFWEVTIEVYKK